MRTFRAPPGRSERQAHVDARFVVFGWRGSRVKALVATVAFCMLTLSVWMPAAEAASPSPPVIYADETRGTAFAVGSDGHSYVLGSQGIREYDADGYVVSFIRHSAFGQPLVYPSIAATADILAVSYYYHNRTTTFLVQDGAIVQMRVYPGGFRVVDAAPASGLYVTWPDHIARLDSAGQVVWLRNVAAEGTVKAVGVSSDGQFLAYHTAGGITMLDALGQVMYTVAKDPQQFAVGGDAALYLLETGVVSAWRYGTQAWWTPALADAITVDSRGSLVAGRIVSQRAGTCIVLCVAADAYQGFEIWRYTQSGEKYGSFTQPLDILFGAGSGMRLVARGDTLVGGARYVKVTGFSDTAVCTGSPATACVWTRSPTVRATAGESSCGSTHDLLGASRVLHSNGLPCVAIGTTARCYAAGCVAVGVEHAECHELCVAIAPVGSSSCHNDRCLLEVRDKGVPRSVLFNADGYCDGTWYNLTYPPHIYNAPIGPCVTAAEGTATCHSSTACVAAGTGAATCTYTCVAVGQSASAAQGLAFAYNGTAYCEGTCIPIALRGSFSCRNDGCSGVAVYDESSCSSGPCMRIREHSIPIPFALP